VLEILGSTIRFQYEPSSGALSVTATHSARLPPTYTENWLGEPLRILLGQLIFPRLVALNLENGTTHVDVRPCRGPIGGAVRYAALWPGEDFPRGKEDFWRRYSAILTMIARAKNYEAHEITQLYASSERQSASEHSVAAWLAPFDTFSRSQHVRKGRCACARLP
jgi:hypothetical protein